MIKFYNTLTRKKQTFRPIEPGTVKMYSCGPTVYNFAHIGNLRSFIFVDLLRRFLKYEGFKVLHVMNITDVDDKTIRDSKKERLSLKEFTEKYTIYFLEDISALNIQRPDIMPKATEHIPDMIALIKKLDENGYVYKSDDNSVYYKISKFKDYGKFAQIKVKDLKAGARVSQDEYSKEEAQDFALWKAWNPEDGDTFWKTEYGKGRPGWHIECSAMSMKYLGETFDMHTGGVDLIFPHHQNEIAQSEGATGKRFVNYWLHCEHLIVEGKKMSKSLGNFYTLRDVLAKGYKPMAIRYLLMSTHYRQQLNFTFNALEAAQNNVDKLVNFAARLKEIAESKKKTGKLDKEKKKETALLIKNAKKGFDKALEDDLNVSDALAAVFNFITEMNKRIAEDSLDKNSAKKGFELMMQFDSVLGVIGEIKEEKELPEEIMKLINEREEARKSRNFAKADEIRNILKSKGILLDDTKDGVKWRRAD